MTVKKIGGSVAVVIPKSVAQAMNICEGSALDVSAENGRIVMRSREGKRPRRSLRKIVAKLSPREYRKASEELSDRPIGREVW